MTKNPRTPQEQIVELSRGAVTLQTKDELLAKLRKGKPLRVKLGFDPSAPDIHLGHTVVLRKLRQFQDLGHQAVMIIGDFTALVGDPTGRSKTRPQLSPQEVEENAMTYFDQVGKVLDMDKVEIQRNSKWLKPLTFLELVKIAGKMTVNQMLQREDFSKRYKEQISIGLHEFLYVVMQAYDSVVVEADVELGGTDQTFNLLVGRDLMRERAMEPQVCLTMPILRGLDGVKKMSKSLANYIGVTEDAFEMYSKAMKVPDDLMEEYYKLLTQLPVDEIDRLCDKGKTHPKAAKDRLAREVAAAFHERDVVDEGAAKWDSLFSKRETPDEAPELKVNGSSRLLDVLMLTKIPKSKSDARRLIQQGGVELDGEKMKDPNATIGAGLLRVGKKKKYFKIVSG